MQFTQASVASTLVAVQDFIARHADRLGAIAVSGAKQQLDEIGAALEADGREQTVCTATERLLTRKRDEARWVLINAHMYPISQVARMEIRSYATLIAFQMPRLSAGDQDLLARASAMSVVARNYAAVLLRTARLRIRIIDRFITVAVKDDAPLLLEWKKTKQVAMKAANHATTYGTRILPCV